MENESKNKLILAVLQGEDYDDTVYELNRNGFFATLLSSTGGFLKKRSVTLMIGVSADKADQVLAILKKRAGKRTETIYQSMAPLNGHSAALPAVPVEREASGAAIFILDLESLQKF